MVTAQDFSVCRLHSWQTRGTDGFPLWAPVASQVQHLRPPAAYLAANWPLRHAALSADGADVAVAGTRGLALYSRRSAHWRLFGNVSQERSLAVQVLFTTPVSDHLAFQHQK